MGVEVRRVGVLEAAEDQAQAAGRRAQQLGVVDEGAPGADRLAACDDGAGGGDGGVLVLVGTLEQFGFEPPFVSLSFFVGYGGFVTALLVLGVTLLFRRGLPVGEARA